VQTGEHCKYLPGLVGLWKPLALLTVHLSASGLRDFSLALRKHMSLCFECPLQVTDEMIFTIRLRWQQRAGSAAYES